jgi:hypothetical protein
VGSNPTGGTPPKPAESPADQQQHGQRAILCCPAVSGEHRRLPGICAHYVPEFYASGATASAAAIRFRAASSCPTMHFGVDLVEHPHAVPGPLGDLRRGPPALSHVDTAACRRSYGRAVSRGPGFLGRQHLGTGLSPHPAVRARGQFPAAHAAEQQPVRSGAEALQVHVQQRRQIRRARHDPRLALGPCLSCRSSRPDPAPLRRSGRAGADGGDLLTARQRQPDRRPDMQAGKEWPARGPAVAGDAGDGDPVAGPVRGPASGGVGGRAAARPAGVDPARSGRGRADHDPGAGPAEYDALVTDLDGRPLRAVALHERADLAAIRAHTGSGCSPTNSSAAESRSSPASPASAARSSNGSRPGSR